MPNSKSAKKRLRQDEALRIHNRSIKSDMKTQIKKVLAAVDAGNVAEAEEQFIVAQKKLDQADSKNIIHKNAASRQKARLQRLIKKAKSS